MIDVEFLEVFAERILIDVSGKVAVAIAAAVVVAPAAVGLVEAAGEVDQESGLQKQIVGKNRKEEQANTKRPPAKLRMTRMMKMLMMMKKTKKTKRPPHMATKTFQRSMKFEEATQCWQFREPGWMRLQAEEPAGTPRHTQVEKRSLRLTGGAAKEGH